MFLWPISEEEQSGDSDLFLHEAVFTHSSFNGTSFSRKVSEQNVNEAGKIASFSTAASNKHSPINVYSGSFEGIVNIYR